MAENESSKIIIPMKVLAYRVKDEKLTVSQINPSYNTLGGPTLGKNITPQALTSTTKLPQGIHLHFVLPSGLKHGEKKSEETAIKYPAVPDKFIITRMYVKKKDGKKIIVNDCNIVDSSFVSKENKGGGVTIPFMDDKVDPYRYLGRQYSAFESVPSLDMMNKEGHLVELNAIGPGDPLFNAYYPNCRGVFGYYDDLKNIPEEDICDAVLTYSVIGYYSNADKDPFSKVDSVKSMKQVLSVYNLSAENDTICNSCLLFGEVCDINLSDNDPWFTTKNVNMGVGRTTAEALSAILKGKYSNELDPNNDLERKLTSILYGMADETTQIDGNHKIDDSIHSYGFTSNAPFEIYHEVIFPKDVEFEDPIDVLSKLDDLNKQERKVGTLRRKLEYEKNILYYLWEKYVDTSDRSPSKRKLLALIDDAKKRIDFIRNVEFPSISKDLEKKFVPALQDALSKIKKKKKKKSEEIKIEETSAKPFYVPKDPVIMLFGDAVHKSFASIDEEGFEDDHTLYCLTSPLSCNGFDNIKELISKIDVNPFNSDYENDEYLKFLVMTVILDKINIIPRLGISNLEIDRTTSENMLKVMVNNTPKEEHALFMEWQTNFYNDYNDCDYDIGDVRSSFEYGHTDYTYNGGIGDDLTKCFGWSVLTPHGVHNLEEKLIKYGMEDLAGEIRDLPALSQNLGGFTINLLSLKYVFQLPMNFKDDITGEVQDRLDTRTEYYTEGDSERLAIEGTRIIPLREGFLNFENLSIRTSFGNRTPVIEESLKYQADLYFSENLHPIVTDASRNVYCFLPLALTTPARLSSSFVSAANENITSCSLPGSSPIIAIIMPDLLNKNLNVYDSKGMFIGVLKKVFRNIDARNIPKSGVGRFMRVCSEEDYEFCDERIKKFLETIIGKDPLTEETTSIENSTYLPEIMNVVEYKLSNTIPTNQCDFIFGRILVLAEINIELEYYGGTQVAINKNNDNVFDDKGLSEKEFPVMIGDIERVTDGVVCGFYGDDNNFEKGFAAFGYDTQKNEHLNAPHPKVCGSTPEKNVTPKKITLLLDPMQKVTLSTGFLPVEQIQINACHTDFSGMNLMSTEMNMLVSEKNRIQLPDFIKDEKFTREYPTRENNKVEYKTLNVEKASPAIGTIDKTFITDGFIVKNK